MDMKNIKVEKVKLETISYHNDKDIIVEIPNENIIDIEFNIIILFMKQNYGNKWFRASVMIENPTTN